MGFPVTSDRCIHFNLFIWQKRRMLSHCTWLLCLCLYFQVIPQLHGYSIIHGYCPQYFISQDSNRLAEIISPCYRQKNLTWSHLLVPIKRTIKLPQKSQAADLPLIPQFVFKKKKQTNKTQKLDLKVGALGFLRALSPSQEQHLTHNAHGPTGSQGPQAWSHCWCWEAMVSKGDQTSSYMQTRDSIFCKVTPND